MEKKDSAISDQLRKRLKYVCDLLDEFDLEEKEKKAQQAADNEPKQYLGELPHRVIHLKNNLMEMEIKAKEKEFDQLKKDNERLRARCALLESGNNADVTRRIDDAVDHAHQIDVLTRRVVEFKRREEKILHSLRKTSREIRKAIYLLTGYRVDALKDRIYRLSNMYAEGDEDRLFFEVSPDGTIQLLKNEHSGRFSEYITTYLENGDSFPAFLASITLNLFKSTTQRIPIPMSMSTTIRG